MNEIKGKPTGNKTKQAFINTGALLGALVDNLQDGILFEDENRTILYANRRFCELFRISSSPEALVNADWRSALKNSGARFDQPERYEQRIEDIIARNEAVFGEELLLSDGRVVERDYTPVPIGERLRGRLWKFRDITKRKRVEKLLHESERRNQDLLENVRLVGVMLDAAGNITFCNNFLLTLTGWNIEEVLGRNWFDVFVPDSAVKTVFAQAMSAGTIPSYFENEIRTRRGEVRTISWNNIVLRDTAGRVVGTASIGEDVTEKKKAEEVMIRYSLLSRHARDIILFVDMSGRILEANEAAEKSYGYSHEEFRSLTIADLRAEHTRDAITGQLAQAYEKGLLLETEHCRKDGSMFPVEVSSTGVTIGGRTVLLSIIRDITRRKQAEDELEKIFTLSSDMICIADLKEQSFKKVNPAFTSILGYEEKEFLGKPIMSFIHPDDKEPTLARIQDELARGTRTVSFMNRYRHKDGTYRYLEWMTRPMPEQGVSYAIARDITERKKMEQEIFKLQKLESIGVLAGGIAHDFNNLLMGIMGNISFSRMLVSPDNRIYQLLSDAEAACVSAKDLSYRLLTFSKGGVPVRQPASLEKIIQDSVNIALAGSFVSVECDIPGDLPLVDVDEGQIRQVLNNLLINAREAMPAGGLVRIQARTITLGESDVAMLSAGHYIRLLVQDSGVGIPDMNLVKIFDPYFTTRELGSQKGRGLGLAICHSIIRKHDGTITVESTVGKGTTFFIYLPIISRRLSAASAGPPREAGSRPVKGRILVMDDDERVLTIVKEMLQFIEYDTETAQSGTEANEKYQRAHEAGAPFDLVLLDLTVPGGMGGIETLGKLRERDPAVRAVVSSGYADDPIMKDFETYGFVGAIAKPYDIKQLKQMVLDGIS